MLDRNEMSPERKFFMSDGVYHSEQIYGIF